MSELPIPRTPKDLSADWLTAALRSTGTISTSTVTSIDVEPDIAAGSGFMGQLARVALTYDQREDAAPATLIGKFPTYGPENRAIADMFRMYETETRFYEEIAPKVELRTPRRYYSARAADSTDFILLMEDLAPARCGDQLAGCMRSEAELAVRELAKFHALWWESPALAEFDWIWTFNNAVRSAAAQGAYAATWAPFKELWAHRVPAPILAMGEKFHEALPKLLDRLAARPVTITHGDYRVDNLFFASPQGGAPLAVVDWQIISLGCGPFDLAYFMAGAMPPADRRAIEKDLLRTYYDTLIAHGVKDYDFERCLLDYRISALFCWQYAAIILGTLDATNERGLALFTDILDRFTSIITDLNAVDLLPA